MNGNYPEIPAERADDLHHLEIAQRADLVLFMAGNQFMAMPELISCFQREQPEVKNIFYETLPPGLELQQILAGCALFRGALLTIVPDIYSAVQVQAMQTLEEHRLIETGGYFPYLRNRLTLLVPAGNPAGIRSVLDLGRDEVRISQPDPRHEDIAYHIMNMYRQAGGEALVEKIMETKRVAGKTVLTTVHHRQTPARINEKSVDVGPVWATESIHARRSGLACEVVEPGEILDQRDQVRYYICRLKQGANSENARKFLQFITSPSAGEIFEAYGFLPGAGERR